MTEEQHGWLRKANDSLQAAKLLTDNGFYDAAISRAYYAMFYVATAFLLEDDLRLSRHSAVISAFGQRFAHTERAPTESHRILITAEERRLKADYLPAIQFSEDDARQQVSWAEQFVEVGKRLIGENTASDEE